MNQSEVRQLEGRIQELQGEVHRLRKELASWRNGNEEERKLWEANSASREQLAYVLGNLPLVLWATDCEGRILQFQGAGLERLGLGGGSVYGQPIRSVLCDTPALSEALNRALAGETLTEQIPCHSRTLICHFNPQWNAEKDVVGVRGVALVLNADSLSVPMPKPAEEPARRPQPRNADGKSLNWEAPLLEWSANFPDFVLSVGPDGIIRFINRTIAPAEFDDVIGSSIFDFIVKERHEQLRESIARVFATGEFANCELDSHDPDGATRTYDCRFGPFKPEGRMVSVIVIARDVTELRRGEVIARKRQSDLEHLSRVASMGEMASIVAHYLNNPLAAISNYAHGCIRRLSAGDVDTEQLMDAQQEIVDQCNRSSAYIRHLRGFLQKREVRYIETDLTDILIDAVRLTEPEFRAQDLTVRIDIQEKKPRVYGDALQIEQVLVNLLLNAADAMKPLQHEKSSTPQEEKPAREIVVRVEGTRAGDLQISVIDSGRGLPPGFEEKIFEPFFTTQEKRLGMGLSVSRSIIESHGGRLEVFDNVGPGATFRFNLPRCTAGQFDE